jgi:hypothetical protein
VLHAACLRSTVEFGVVLQPLGTHPPLLLY